MCSLPRGGGNEIPHVPGYLKVVPFFPEVLRSPLNFLRTACVCRGGISPPTVSRSIKLALRCRICGKKCTRRTTRQRAQLKRRTKRTFLAARGGLKFGLLASSAK
jgi:hypothetical protein